MITCEKCKQPMLVSVEITGGCTCHPEDKYCYCDSPDVHVEVFCDTPKCKDKGKRHEPTGLTDQYGVERFIQKHLGNKGL